ncbi:11226_t:CDS:2 [Diversispora eburnea]|uniref:11226_t:CDS:1 n=1 Tax=Diversispora eburnea TaxID=1213867 RepID=A0A9N8ZRG5_9GLOM|nr:11226_t:CDS:2 [Diversispora eburnea]
MFKLFILSFNKPLIIPINRISLILEKSKDCEIRRINSLCVSKQPKRVFRSLPKKIGIKLFLQYNYSPRQLFFQKLNSSRKWTSLEDNILIRRSVLYGWKNWNLIAQGLCNRSPIECFYRWRKLKHQIDLPANQDLFFSSKEFKIFLKRISIYGIDWNKIATGFKNKSIIQCKELYYRLQKFTNKKKRFGSIDYVQIQKVLKKAETVKLNSKILRPRSEWTPEDIKKLKSIVRKQPFYNISWGLIAKEFPGKTAAKCSRKWQDIWDEIEMKSLKDAIEKYGEDWETVSEQIDGRTPLQCKNKWKSLNTVVVKRKPFTEAEIYLLYEIMKDPPLIRNNRTNWVYIAEKYFSDRTSTQIQYKWVTLCRKAWTKEEQQILLQKSEEYEHILDEDEKWINVAKHIPGHTPSECRKKRKELEIKLKSWKKHEHLELILAVKEYGPQWRLLSKKLKRLPNHIEKEYKKLQESNIWLYKDLINYSKNPNEKEFVNNKNDSSHSSQDKFDFLKTGDDDDEYFNTSQ